MKEEEVVEQGQINTKDSAKAVADMRTVWVEQRVGKRT